MSFGSVTTRFAFWTVLASGAVLVVTLVASNHVARQTALAAAELEARQLADRLAHRLLGVLSAVEESAQLLAATLETLDPEPSGIEQLLRRFVASEQDLYGAGVILTPVATRSDAAARNGVPPAGFARYVFGSSEDPAELHALDLVGADARASRASWSEPQPDPGRSGRTVVSYSVPFLISSASRGQPGPRRGRVVASVPVGWLTSIVREVHPGKTGRALLLSRTGRLIGVSDAQSVETDGPLLSQLAPERRAQLEPIVGHMLAGEAGFVGLEVAGRRGRVLYQPIERAGWSLGVFYPEAELMAEARRLRLVETTLGLLGLLVLAAVVVALSRRLTAPIRELAAAARGLSSDLEAPLPPARSPDELGALAEAFAEMRLALQRHVRELQATAAARQRLESELRIARRIQLDMLPERRGGGPQAGYELAALLEPAREVGGDLFDHYAEGGRVYFLIADVSGKGVPAALVMARAMTLFGSAAARLRDPALILNEVNRGLCRENEAGIYVTGICGTVEVASGELAIACAGHASPLHVCGGRPPAPFRLEGGTPLGLFETAAYPLNRVRLEPGDAVFGYTDGVEEARDPSGSLFGLERLIAALAPLAAASPEQVNAGVLEAVRSFATSAEQSDDIAMLTFRYSGLERAGQSARSAS